MFGGPAMGLWEFTADSETIEVPSNILIYYNPSGEGRTSWSHNVLILGLLASCGQKPRLGLSFQCFQLMNSSGVNIVPMATAAFKTNHPGTKSKYFSSTE